MEAILDAACPTPPARSGWPRMCCRTNGCWRVAGTHGKTTTTAMLAWILDDAGLHPGFLIGGMPQNFGVSARLTDSPFFVIEADEYDTAFFDKRSKFVHYRPRTVDPQQPRIRPRRHLPRPGRHRDPVPPSGAHRPRQRPHRRQRHRRQPRARARARPAGPRSSISAAHMDGSACDLAQASPTPRAASTSCFDSTLQGRVKWELIGEHNRMNALAAIAAARHAGVPAATAIDALVPLRERQAPHGNARRRARHHRLRRFRPPSHRHHHHRRRPAGKVGKARILAVLEPRSNTMKLGVMKAALPDSLAAADQVYCYGANLGWDPAEALAPLGDKARVFDDLDKLVSQLVARCAARRSCADDEQRRLRGHSCEAAGCAASPLSRGYCVDAYASVWGVCVRKGRAFRAEFSEGLVRCSWSVCCTADRWPGVARRQVPFLVSPRKGTKRRRPQHPRIPENRARRTGVEELAPLLLG